MTELDEIEPVKDPRRNVVGGVGLTFGGLAACCIPCGCPSWLLTWYAIAPLSGLGLLCGLFGRGWTRRVAVIVNTPLLIFGVGFYAALMQRAG